MIINDTNKQMIREIVVELFKETADSQVFGVNKQVLMLDEHLQDIMSNKIDKYDVKVYGVRLEERL